MLRNQTNILSFQTDIIIPRSHNNPTVTSLSIVNKHHLTIILKVPLPIWQRVIKSPQGDKTFNQMGKWEKEKALILVTAANIDKIKNNWFVKKKKINILWEIFKKEEGGIKFLFPSCNSVNFSGCFIMRLCIWNLCCFECSKIPNGLGISNSNPYFWIFLFLSPASVQNTTCSHPLPIPLSLVHNLVHILIISILWTIVQWCPHNCNNYQE